ncbi:MAG: D-alanyl-D-alanine carboxypeptidase family protein [Oscillospiraceae bacterium]
MKKLAVFLSAALLLSVSAGAEELTMEMEPYEEVPAAVFEEANIPTLAEDIDIPAPSAILIEKETGQVLYEKNADELLEPASVTKVMTILLIVEAVDSGAMSLDDMISVSARAASMGGSQVYLEEGEQMQLSEMLKCIVVSSANDAAVAVAEHMAGSEQAFVARMNERAAELNMTNTNFTNCTGLLESSEHRTSARDIAIMARELIKHDWIKEYTTIWMDTIRDGTFGLSNTNKLIRFYSGATGLKTGYTSSAGHCLAATAERDGVEYIAVVLHCASSADRFESAKTLLSYAFGAYTLVSSVPDEVLPPIKVTLGDADYIQPVVSDSAGVLVKKSDSASITKQVELLDNLDAPVTAGQTVGTLTLSLNGETLSVTDIIAADSVERLTFWDIARDMLKILFFGEG